MWLLLGEKKMYGLVYMLDAAYVDEIWYITNNNNNNNNMACEIIK